MSTSAISTQYNRHNDLPLMMSTDQPSGGMQFSSIQPPHTISIMVNVSVSVSSFCSTCSCIMKTEQDASKAILPRFSLLTEFLVHSLDLQLNFPQGALPALHRSGRDALVSMLSQLLCAEQQPSQDALHLMRHILGLAGLCIQVCILECEALAL